MILHPAENVGIILSGCFFRSCSRRGTKPGGPFQTTPKNGAVKKVPQKKEDCKLTLQWECSLFCDII